MDSRNSISKSYLIQYGSTEILVTVTLVYDVSIKDTDHSSTLDSKGEIALYCSLASATGFENELVCSLVV